MSHSRRFDTTFEAPIPLGIDKPVPITVFSRRHYALIIENDPDAPTTVDDFVECPLVLVHELSRQVLAMFSVYAPPEGGPSIGDEAVPRILWAGDIDRDGNLDLPPRFDQSLQRFGANALSVLRGRRG